MKRDCPQRQGSQGLGTVQSQSSVGQARTQFILPPPIRVGGTSISPKVLYKYLLLHRQNCPQRQGSQGLGTVQSQSSVGQAQTQFILPPQYGSEEPISVPRCCTSTSCCTDKPERPWYGSGPRTGLTGRNVRDAGYVYVISPMG